MGLGKHCPTECQDTPRPGPACAQHCPGWSRVGHVANHTLAQVLGAVHPLTPCGRCYTTSRRRLWAAPPVHAARQGDLGLRDSKAKPAPASGQGPSLPGQGPISRGQASTQRPTASKASTACKAEPQGPGRCCVGRPAVLQPVHLAARGPAAALQLTFDWRWTSCAGPPMWWSGVGSGWRQAGSPPNPTPVGLGLCPQRPAILAPIHHFPPCFRA